MKKSMAMTPKSQTPAQHLTTTVAPFRAWRGLRLTLAEGPEGATIESRIIRSLGGECKRQKTLRNAILRSPSGPLAHDHRVASDGTIIVCAGPGRPIRIIINLNNIHRHTNNVAPIRPARQKNNPLTIEMDAMLDKLSFQATNNKQQATSNTKISEAILAGGEDFYTSHLSMI